MNLEQVFSSQHIEFLSESYFMIPNWKWIVLGLGFTIGLVLLPFLKAIFRYSQNRFLEKTRNTGFIKYLLETSIENNLSWILVTLIFIFAIDISGLPLRIDRVFTFIIKIILYLNIFSFCYRLIEAFVKVLTDRAAKTESTLDDQLVPFASKTLKFLVIVIGGLLGLQSFGVNVTSVLAGLGIGGLAISFAAQETISALIGSIVILLDNPFQLNDYIKVGSVEGTVEQIGFRSTRIRTLENSLVTIPNSTMAKENIDNLSLRHKRRVRQNLGILYETDVAKIEAFIDSVKYRLCQDPMIDKNDIFVTFNNFGDFSLSILVNYYVLSPKIEDYHRVQQETFLELLKIAQKTKVDFAYPTQTLYHRNVQSTAPGSEIANEMRV